MKMAPSPKRLAADFKEGTRFLGMLKFPMVEPGKKPTRGRPFAASGRVSAWVKSPASGKTSSAG